MKILLLLGVLAIAIAYLLGLALQFLRSKNQNPLAALATEGEFCEAEVVELEPDGDEPNVLVRYEVLGQEYRRALPWNPNKALPEIGTRLQVRYLPSNPGLARFV